MSREREAPVRLAFAGHQTKVAFRICKGILLILVSVLGFVSWLPTLPPVNATPSQTASSNGSTTSPTGSQFPPGIGADPVPDLHLPRTVLSTVDGLVEAGGVIQTSPDNLTLYNSRASLRLLGGQSPRDEILGPDRRPLSNYSFWAVQVYASGSWIQLKPSSSNFTLLGTNKTGTYLTRTMNVGTSPYTGILRILYRAIPNGPINWNPEFVSGFPAQYRLTYSWHNTTTAAQLDGIARRYTVNYGVANYTFSWADIPPTFNTVVNGSRSRFDLLVNLGTLPLAGHASVDPSIISTSASPTATADATQRKVFYDSIGGRYWVFYYNTNAVMYANSADGVTWSTPNQMPSGWPSNPDVPTVLNIGQSVVVAGGETNTTNVSLNGSRTAYVYFVTGSLSGSRIYWGQVNNFLGVSTNQVCDPAYYGQCETVGTRYVSVTQLSNGYLAFSFNGYKHVGVETGWPYNPCTRSWVTAVVTNGAPGVTVLDSGYYCDIGFRSAFWDDFESTVLPANSYGGLSVVYSDRTLNPVHYDGQHLEYRYIDPWYGLQPVESVGYLVETPSIIFPARGVFSAVSDADYGIHAIFKTLDNTTSEAFRSANGWVMTLNIFSGSYSFPSLTVDRSTNDLYAFAANGTAIVMKGKTTVKSWSDVSDTFPVIGRPASVSYLVSDFASASISGSPGLSLVWTESTGTNQTYNVVFASIPIAIGWSPYANPADPWDGNGIAPYAQYFSNMGEYVSPSSGTLTVRQTDLSVPGRGLNLDITRVYTQPQTLLLTGAATGYEPYRLAPMGLGWQLSFPWMRTGGPNPQVIHLWNGEGYLIPSSFWNGSSALFENHLGENFRLVRSSSSMTLYAATGTTYQFDNTRLLRTITDPTGNNVMAFSYNGTGINWKIFSITDSLQRVFLFCYNNLGSLQSINQTLTNCNNTTGSKRGIVYRQTGNDLTSVTDPAGRVTYYSYDSTGWLIARITYPTNWFESYTFAPRTLTTNSMSYRVASQTLRDTQGVQVRKNAFSYNYGLGNQVANSTVATYNGTSIVSYTSYSFSASAVQWNVTDSTHFFVRGELQHFGARGEIVRDTVIVARDKLHGTSLGSYTNYYQYDLWGNLIWSNRAIYKPQWYYDPSPSTYHQSFNSYYNDGLPPGFNAFQESFSQNQGSSPDNLWSVTNGYWIVKNGAYNGTAVAGAQEGMFSWSNIGQTDVALVAQVYPSRTVNGSNPRIGIFAHYPGIGNGKWALVLETTSAGTFLGLLDDSSGSFVATASCLNSSGILLRSIVLNTWYKFTLIISGTQATGYLSVPALQVMNCLVSGSFSTSSGLAGATGFGLYSGGFSAWFDNVTVTVPSVINIPNYFIPGGSPGTNTHNAPAGTAEFQNGPGTQPIETYYGYTSWGGLNQTRQIYNSPSGIRWLTTTRTYDSYGNLLTAVDPRGNSTSYGYSPKYQNAYLTSKTENLVPGNIQIINSYGYNFTTGAMTWSQDPSGYGTNGYNTTYHYDILGRLTKVTYPNSDYKTYTYNDQANYVDTINENGWKTRQIFDGIGRLLTVEKFSTGLPYSNETYTYNWLDKVVTDKDPRQRTTSYQYDPLGRLVKTTSPDGNFTQLLYDDMPSDVYSIGQAGIWKYYTYDRLGRLIYVDEASIEGSGAEAQSTYTYDEVGNLLQVSTNFQGTNYSYDSLNRVTSIGYPDGTSESYTYDNNGNLVGKIDRKNAQTLYGYDSLNRLTTTTYCGATITSDNYGYDNNGNIVSLQNQNATIGYGYDSRNRMTVQTYAINTSTRTVNLGCPGGSVAPAGGISQTYQVGYSYVGETMSGISYPDGLVANYSYDPLGRVASVATSKTTYASFSYYTEGQIQGVSYGNGIAGHYTYDRNGRLGTINVTRNNGQILLLSLVYGYSKIGTVSNISGQNNGINLSEQYSYDLINRLTNFTLTRNSSQTTGWYQFDVPGNRVAQSINGTLTTYSYNQQNNELGTATTGGAGTSYGYFADGTLRSENVTSTHWTYAWDLQGRLLKAWNNNVIQGAYAYDGQGRRVEAIEGSATFYAYLGTDTLYEKTSGQTAANDYIYAGGMRIARVTGLSTTVYYHTDLTGSTRMVTDSSKTPIVLFSDNYQPFGLNNGSPTGSETYRFTGKPVSQTTGLYYEYQRWYDPSIGRFISQDPLPGQLSLPQSLDPYAYAVNQPTILTDPTGAIFCVGDGNLCDPGSQDYNGNCRICEADGGIGDSSGQTGATQPTSWPEPTPTTVVADTPPEVISITADTTTPTITDTNPTTVTETNAASSSASVSELEGARPSWPANAQGMEDLLGKPGTSIPDTADTPGRGKIFWEIRSDPSMRIVGEQHPYRPDFSTASQAWHWHVDPGHYWGYPGTPIPGWLVKILTAGGYL